MHPIVIALGMQMVTGIFVSVASALPSTRGLPQNAVEASLPELPIVLANQTETRCTAALVASCTTVSIHVSINTPIGGQSRSIDHFDAGSKKIDVLMFQVP
jgi:hypothetical protein